MPNERIQIGDVNREMTDEEQAALDASRAANAPAQALAATLASIYAPIEYPQGSGVFYDPRRFADFDSMRGSQGRGKLNRAPIRDVNGLPQQFATGAEIKALADYIEDVVTARSHAAYDAIFTQ